MRKIIKISLLLIVGAYILFCSAFYFGQEKLLFYPIKLDESYNFRFVNGEEINLTSPDGIRLNNLLIKSTQTSSKGLIFFLHGNAGALDRWGYIAKFYNELGYDVFIPGYRGFGKSEGNISNQKQLFDDAQQAYEYIKGLYKEDQIIVMGFSIGTGIAAHLASENNPCMLILNAPYYNLETLVKSYVSFAPTFLLKYSLETDKYLRDCEMPIILFHGDNDEIIHYENSMNLKEYLKASDKIIILRNQKHNNIDANADYRNQMKEILQ